ncbi:hypothetical protein FRC12_010141 [Ceratobasidium sp. 428]|nr:hypothetical protein FRC12_010141 [Ceratobasidium sp. 428]
MNSSYSSPQCLSSYQSTGLTPQPNGNALCLRSTCSLTLACSGAPELSPPVFHLPHCFEHSSATPSCYTLVLPSIYILQPPAPTLLAALVSICTLLAYNPITVCPWSARILRCASLCSCLRDQCDPDGRLGLDKTSHQSRPEKRLPCSTSSSAVRSSSRRRRAAVRVGRPATVGGHASTDLTSMGCAEVTAMGW